MCVFCGTENTKQRGHKHRNVNLIMKCDLEGKMVFKRSNLNVFGCHSKPSQRGDPINTMFLLHLKHFEFRGHVHTFHGTKCSNNMYFSTLKLALPGGKRFLLHTRKNVAPVPRAHFDC